MSINLKIPDVRELKPRITVFGTGGAGGNAVNNMITSGLQGVDFVVANTDAQALTMSKAERIIQMGVAVTEGLGAGSQPEVGRAAAEEAIDEIRDHLQGAHMVFVTAGMGGGTGTGAAPVVARCAKEAGILTVGVITKPFHFEGIRRMRVAEQGIVELQKVVDTLLIIPNQNLFRVANEKTTFADAFAMADQVLYSGVACITDLMVKEGLINLDFADVRAVMREMGKAMMGTGEASGEKRALSAAEAAISNPLIDDASMKGAKGLLISITGGKDLTLYEVDEAATRIREEVDQDANIIVGATFDESLEGVIRVSVVATGIDHVGLQRSVTEPEVRIAELTQKLRAEELRGDVQRVTTERIETRPLATPSVAAPAAPSAEAIEAAAKAAVAAAVLPMIEDVTIRPIPPKPSLFPEQMALPSDPPPAPRAFIPPAPERDGQPAAPHAWHRRVAASRHRQNCGPSAVRVRSTIRKSARSACCGGLLPWASAAATSSRKPRKCRPMSGRPGRRRLRAPWIGRSSGPLRRRPRRRDPPWRRPRCRAAPSRSPNMPSAPPTTGSML